MKLILFAWFALLACIAPVRAASGQNPLEQMLVLANQGNAEAQYHVGMMYNNGIHGASKDPTTALSWFLKSAAGKDPLGAYKAGCYYANQFPGVVTPDLQLALDYKLLAAEAGYALAQHDVAMAYLRARDFAQTEKWLVQAAQQGNLSSIVALVTLYSGINGGPSNPEKAYTYFKIASQLMGSTRPEKMIAHGAKLASQLSEDQIQSANKLALEWRTTPTPLTLDARNSTARFKALLQASPPSLPAEIQ